MRHVRYALLAGVAVVGLSSIASAADMPIKAPVYVPAYNWTGFYVGGDVGYGWGTQKNTATTGNANFPVGFVFAPSDLTGAVAGGHAGYNYQKGQFVVGIEGDLDWANMKGSTTDVSPLRATSTAIDAKLTWLADITLRAGYAWNNWLLYAKGGAAWAHTEGSSVTTGIAASTTSGSETRSGWLIGGGLEWGFAQRWSAKVEYNYFDFGTKDVIRVTDSTGFQNHRDSSLTMNVVKVGVSYRF